MSVNVANLAFDLEPSQVQDFLQIPRDTPLQPIFDHVIGTASRGAVSSMEAKTNEYDRELFLSHTDSEFANARGTVLSLIKQQNEQFERQHLNRKRKCVETPLDALAWQRRLVLFSKVVDDGVEDASGHMLQMQLNSLGENSGLLFESLDMLFTMGDTDLLTKERLMSDRWIELLSKRQTTLSLLLIEVATLLSTDLLVEPANKIRDVVRNVLTFVRQLHDALKAQWEFVNGDVSERTPASEMTADRLISKTKLTGTRLLSQELVPFEPSRAVAARSRSPSRRSHAPFYFNNREVVVAASSAGPLAERTLTPEELHRATTSATSVGWQTYVTTGVVNVLLALLSHLAEARKAAGWAAEYQAVSQTFIDSIARAFGYDPVNSSVLNIVALPYALYQWVAWFLIGANQTEPPWDWLYLAFSRLMLRIVPTPLYFLFRYTVGGISWVHVAQIVYNIYAVYRVAQRTRAIERLLMTNDRERLVADVERSVMNRFVQYAANAMERRENPLMNVSRGDDNAPLILKMPSNDDDESGSDSDIEEDPRAKPVKHRPARPSVDRVIRIRPNSSAVPDEVYAARSQPLSPLRRRVKK